MLIAEPLLAKALVVVLALLLHVPAALVLGARLRALAFPRLAETLADGFVRRLNRPGRSAAALAWRGGAMTVVLGLTGFGIGALFERAATLSPGAWLFLPAALAAGLAVLRPVAEAARALALLERPAGALALEERRVLPAQTIEQVAAGLNAGLVAPLFWYALLGLPGLGLYTALSAAGRAVAQPSVPRSAFGETPRRLALIIDLVPLWISGLVFLAASLLVPRCSPAAGIRALSAAVTRPGWIIANPAIAILAGLLRTELANHRADRGAGWNFAVGLGVGPPLAPQLRAAMALYGVAVIQALLGFLLTVYLAARVS